MPEADAPEAAPPEAAAAEEPVPEQASDEVAEAAPAEAAQTDSGEDKTEEAAPADAPVQVEINDATTEPAEANPEAPARPAEDGDAASKADEPPQSPPRHREPMSCRCATAIWRRYARCSNRPRPCCPQPRGTPFARSPRRSAPASPARRTRPASRACRPPLHCASVPRTLMSRRRTLLRRQLRRQPPHPNSGRASPTPMPRSSIGCRSRCWSIVTRPRSMPIALCSICSTMPISTTSLRRVASAN